MIWAIADLHFDPIGDKSMDIFGDNWIEHENKIIDDWREKVSDDDLVLIPGDISWALKLEEAYEDLKIIDSLPGKKAMIKGNHDYWWGTKNKLSELGLKSIEFIYNSHYVYKDYVIFGTRGWYSRDAHDFDENDEKIFKRELNRLQLSIDSYQGDDDKTRIAMIHYPPLDFAGNFNEFFQLMIDNNIQYCIYGHLHGEGHSRVVEGNFHNINLKCVSCDYLDFKLIRLF